MQSLLVKLYALARSLPLALLPQAINSSIVIVGECSGRLPARRALVRACCAYNHFAFLNRQYKVVHVTAMTSSAAG